MKCPVCDNVNMSRVCQKCGFDSSRDYEKYPTFGAVGEASAVSALRQEWGKKQPEEETVIVPVPPELRSKKKSWLTVVACTAMLVLGIGIGVGLGGGKVESHKPWETNILRSDEVADADGDGSINDEANAFSVLGSEYRREQISTVTFLDTLQDMPEDTWDVSEAGNGTVLAWVKPNGELYDLYIGAEGGVSAGRCCESMFAGYANASIITFGDAFHTDGVETMKRMFRSCSSLEVLQLGDHFDTANVQNMRSMFNGCGALTELSLGSSFDTSNVQNMYAMFFECNSLTKLALGESFDTSNVQDMCAMFFDCTSLTELTLGDRFDTSNVQDMRWMFSNCTSLTELALGDRFDTTNADTSGMFDNCPAGENYRHLLS